MKKGFTSIVIVFGLVIVIALIGGIFYFVRQSSKKDQSQTTNTGLQQKDLQNGSASPAEIPSVKQKLSFMSGFDLYIANSDGSEKQLVYTAANAQVANYLSWDWSPDNKFIIINGVVIVNISTNKQTTIPSNGRCSNWSPDGKKIISEANGIYVMDNNGQNYKKLTTDGSLCRGSNDVHHWLSDSSGFVYTDNAGVNKFDISINKNTLLYDSNKTQIDALSVSVSKDGSKIAFVGRTKYDVNKKSTVANIYISNSDGTNVQQVTNLKDVDEPGDASFTPDGSKIVFSANNTYSQYNGLSVMNLQDNTIKVISSSQADSYYPPNISSDGQFAAYDGDISGVLGTHLINIQTGKETILPYSAVHTLWSK